jgi:acetyl esterase/lipase
VRVYQRKDVAVPNRVVIWFHGGAFVGGSLDMPEAELVAFELADQTNALVYSVDYRLVDDQTRFPCAQEDALDVLHWVREQLADLGLADSDVFIGGASAGACLAGSLSLLARDRGIRLGGVMPIYPVAHMHLPEFSAEIKQAIEGIFAFDQEFSALHNPWLVEGMTDAEIMGWHCFPGDTVDKSGQGKFLVIQAQRDSLRASGDLWVEQLREAGLEITAETIPGAEHGYLNRNPLKDSAASHTIQLMAKFIA